MADNRGVIKVSRGMARVIRKRVFWARLEKGLNRIAGGLGLKKRFMLQNLNRDTSRKSLNN